MELDDNYFMKQALKQALMAFDDDEVPIGAVVVSGNEIVGKGYNQTKRLNDPTAHAEMLAITAASNALNTSILDTCRLYITVEPCVMCAGAIKWARLEKIVYGTSEPKSGFTMHKPSVLHPKTTVVQGVLEDETRALMSDFFRAKREG